MSFRILVASAWLAAAVMFALASPLRAQAQPSFEARIALEARAVRAATARARVAERANWRAVKAELSLWRSNRDAHALLASRNQSIEIGAVGSDRIVLNGRGLRVQWQRLTVDDDGSRYVPRDNVAAVSVLQYGKLLTIKPWGHTLSVAKIRSAVEAGLAPR